MVNVQKVMQKQQKIQIIKGLDNFSYFWKYKKYYTLLKKTDSLIFLKIFETLDIALDDIKFMKEIEEAERNKEYSFIAKYTKEYMKLRSKKFKYTKPVREIYFYRKKNKNKKKRKRYNHPYWTNVNRVKRRKRKINQRTKKRKYIRRFRNKHKKLYKTLFANYRRLKLKRKIGVCLYNTLNNFYILVIDYSIKSRPILAFVSGGMINSHKRFNRKRYHTVELCSRKISYYLKKRGFRLVSLFIYSFFRRKFIRIFLRAMRYHWIYLRRIYDFRRKAHNGCVLRKVRRL